MTDIRNPESDITRVAHSALILRPLFELGARRIRHSEEGQNRAWSLLDPLWLAFAMLDTISIVSEYQIGATRDEIFEKIRPHAKNQIEAQHKRVKMEEIEEVLHRIFDHLTNREQGYLPFSYPLWDPDSGHFLTRKFWLVKYVYSDETADNGRARFTLTDEGYSAYFGLHETGALDAAAIGNLRIRMFIERGNIEDAIGVADQNRKQCQRKASEVRGIRRAIQRNILSVDFNRINDMANDGAEQASRIQMESGRLHHIVLDNLETTSKAEHGAHLVLLAQRLERLGRRQLELVHELQTLPEDYHDNGYKLFRKRTMGLHPTPEQILETAALLPEADAAKIGHEFLATFDPPIRPTLFDPAGLIEGLERSLDRQGESGDTKQAVQEIDGVSLLRYMPELTPRILPTPSIWWQASSPTAPGISRIFLKPHRKRPNSHCRCHAHLPVRGGTPPCQASGHLGFGIQKRPHHLA